MIVRATEIRPAGTYTTTPAQKLVVVPFGANMADMVSRAGCDASSIMITAIDQPDCKYFDGCAESKSFDHWCAEHTDWSKLPDWPAWSGQMFAEPLGVH